MKQFVTLILLLAGANINAQVLEWVKPFKASGNFYDNEASPLTFANGWVYIGLDNEYPRTCEDDTILYKADTAGNVSVIGKTYATDMVINGETDGQHIARDVNDNLYLSGFYSGLVDWNKNPNDTFLLEQAGATYSFFIKFDSTGVPLWGYTYGVEADIYDMEVDNLGNLYIAGNFEEGAAAGMFDADPGIAQNLITTQSPTTDIFIAKFSTDGNLLWLTYANSTEGSYVTDIQFDADNNLYVTGTYWDSITFDVGGANTVRAGIGNYDIFMLKYDANGTLQNVATFGSNFNETFHSLQVSPQGDVFAGGFISGPMTIAGVNGTYNYTGNDIYVPTVACFNNTLQLKWLSTIENAGAAASELTNIAYLNNGTVVAVGSVTSLPDFDPSPATYNLTPKGGGDGFVSMYNAANGELNCAFLLGGVFSSNERAWDVEAVSDSQFVVLGRYSDTTDFDPGINEYNLLVTPNKHFYLAKYATGNCADPLPTSMANVYAEDNILIYPNPATNMVTVKAEKNIIQLSITDALGRSIFSEVYTGSSNVLSLNIENYPKGLYFVSIKVQGNEFKTSKLLVK